MYAYITLGTNDSKRAKRFYDAVMATIGQTCTVDKPNETGYGPANPDRGPRITRLYVLKPYLGYPATWGNGTQICFDAATRTVVDAFHAAALANGGSDDGKPGLRPYHANFYSCYVRDPDGNKLSAVCETPE
jgi:catechol 2,3-dioxygenase-like lactoylglutathione lyase family enzyme